MGGEEYIRRLETAVRMARSALAYMIDERPMLAAKEIDFGNGCVRTVGNIRAELSNEAITRPWATESKTSQSDSPR